MKTFDIFSGTAEGDAMWQCAVEGLAEAVSAMKNLANKNSGSYFVYDTENAKVLAAVVGPTLQPETPANRESNAA
jgi:hypothetical protein